LHPKRQLIRLNQSFDVAVVSAGLLIHSISRLDQVEVPALNAGR
jgi:hypothetical protein